MRAAQPTVKQLVADNHVLLLRSDGKLYGWGDNTHGQLGLGTATTKYTKPQAIKFFEDKPPIVNIAVADNCSFVQTADRKVWVAGENKNNILQVSGSPRVWTESTTLSNALLEEIHGDPGLTFAYARDIKGSDSKYLVWGSTYAYGRKDITYNFNGLHGFTTPGATISGIDNNSHGIFYQYSDYHYDPVTPSEYSRVTRVYKLEYLSNGYLSNSWYRGDIDVMINDNDNANWYNPQLVNTGAIVNKGAHIYFPYSGGELVGHYYMTDSNMLLDVYYSGRNVGDYYLGKPLKECTYTIEGYTTNNWAANDSGYVIYQANNRLSGWGNNEYGKLGINSTTGQTEGTPVGINAAGVQEVVGGEDANYFVMKNGDVYAAGSNLLGQLGQGDEYYQTSSSVPLKVNFVVPPQVTHVEVPTSWGLTATATITAKDGGAGVKDYAISSSSAAPSSGWQTSATFTLSANGTYYAFARDNYNSVSEAHSFTVTKIDRTPPTITNTSVSGTWGITNTVTLQATDSASGVKDYAIATTASAPGSGWQTSTTFTVSENGTYYVFARDTLGNVSSGTQVTVNRIDKKPPTINSISIPDTWGQTNSITINAVDSETGIKEYAISTTNATPAEWQTLQVFKVSANGTYYAFVRDHAGNVTRGKEFTITKVDADKPVISSVDVPTEWVQKMTLP